MMIIDDLRDKVVLVTGGTRGIGRALVERLLEAGARVGFTYRTRRDAAEELLARETAGAERLCAFQADVADFARAREVVNELCARWERVDALVNNAGVSRDNPLVMMTEAAWDETIDTNLKGVFNYSRACIFRMMKAKRGAIVNLASVAAVRSIRAQSAYGASKAGIVQFTRTLAQEVAPLGIRVNCVAPGFVKTDMVRAAEEKYGDQILAMIPMHRHAEPREIADSVLFLLSEASGYVTGHALVVDGGLSL
jgi:3-oxoacyl-[acyl-carrier protein] reductase